MKFERAIEIANIAISAKFGRPMSDVETAILKGAWLSQTYEQIAETSGYSVSYLTRDVGPKFWKLLSQALGEAVSKTNFQATLQRWGNQGAIESTQPGLNSLTMRGATFDRPASPEVASPPPVLFTSFQSSLATSEPSFASPTPSPFSKTTRCDWGEAIDVSLFYGRSQELELLERWISHDRCRLIALLGMGGVGKTSLSVKIAQQVVSRAHGTVPGFDCVIWRSLRNAPCLETLLGGIIGFLSHQQDTGTTLDRLLHWLRTARCLIILDNGETILQGGDRAGHYRPGYENYGELFRVVGESAHQSCLILTSREKPSELAVLEGIDLSVRSLRLGGSPEAAQQILTAKGLSGSDQDKQRLIELYGGNPLALKIIATSIQDLFDSEINLFLSQSTPTVFNGIQRLLDQQCQRCSPIEKTIMYWLAINRDWTTIAELADDIVPSVSRAELLDALESLSWRSLIEKQPGSYTQQPVVMEYITNHLIETLYTEVVRPLDSAAPGSAALPCPSPVPLFQSHALIKSTVKGYVRDSQVQFILDPIASKLYATYGSKAAVAQRLRMILAHLQAATSDRSPMPRPILGYAASNLIHLCRHLQIDLTGFDFSNLSIRQAYLQGLTLRQVNFHQAEFYKTAFTQTFGSVLSVAFSPDGALLAAGDANGEVRVWQVSTGQLLLTLSAHRNWVWAVAWSPAPSPHSGREGTAGVLASCSYDQTIKVWDVKTGRCLKTLQGHRNSVLSIDWNASGTLLASGSTDHTIKVWEVETGRCVHTFQGHGGWVRSVAWNPKASTLASGGDDQMIKVWATDTGLCTQTLNGHQGPVRAVTWHPDGQSLASGGDDQTVRVWDVSQNVCLRTLAGHQNSVRSVAWSADGRTLVSGSYDQTVWLWDAPTGQCLQILQEHTDAVISVAWSPNGMILASGSYDHTVKVWNVANKEYLRTLRGYSNWIWSVAWNPLSGTAGILASGSDDQTVRLWDTSTGTCIRALQGHQNSLRTVAWAPDGHWLASGSTDCTIRVWDTLQGHCLYILREHQNSVRAVAWSPDGRFLASASDDRTVKLWDLSTGYCLKSLEEHGGSVWAIAWSPDGTLLASGSSDQTIKLWDVSTGRCQATLRGHQDLVLSLAWQPEGNLLASSSYDQTIRLWDITTEECRWTLHGHQNLVGAIAWHPTDPLLASGSADRHIKLWSSQTGECLQTLTGCYGSVGSLSWSCDGRTLASSGADERIQLWERRTETGLPDICTKILRAERPYEGMNITGVKGLTEAERATLKLLGAIEEGPYKGEL